MSAADIETIEHVLKRMTSTEKLALIDRVARDLRSGEARRLSDQQILLKALRAELLALPVHNPADGFSNVDHDRVLYRDCPANWVVIDVPAD